MGKIMMGLLVAVMGVFCAEAAPAARTFARYVPERIDDFAWENDKIAFRAYGPKARKGAENSGIDCWLKRVEYPIIDKWYGKGVSPLNSSFWFLVTGL